MTVTLKAFTNVGKVDFTTPDFALFMKRLDALHLLGSPVEVKRVDH